ncbi:MAG: LysR family transcriptional regulator [Wenzhouxiangella sp.]|jgi:DNA-binding transcriptional LysR family regulator|nr:LysR family transcriptional regulator [Wenzhouxiangella sp.]
MIELRHLAHAIALAEHRNFARAAKALHMSQPALTRNIQMLEERMGKILFDRMRSGVLPTDAGQLLLRRAKAILGQADDLMREVGGMGAGEQEEIRIAAGPYPAAMVLSQAIASMLKKRPGLRFRVVVDHWVDTIRKLRDRRVDFALCESSEIRDPEFSAVPLLHHQGRPVVRAEHPILESDVTTLKQLMKWPLAITARIPPRILEKLIPAAELSGGFEPTVHCEDMGVLKSLLLSSDVVGFFPLSMMEEELLSGRVVPLKVGETWLHTNFSLFHMKNRELSAVANDFIEELKLADACVAEKNQELSKFAERRANEMKKGRNKTASKAK